MQSFACVSSGALGIDATTPILHVPLNPPSVVVDGIPFAQWFFGDDFDNDHIPFHYIPDYGQLPEPAEDVDVAIVGGGLSGLTSAYLLRHHNTVLFELRDRFGGNALGETWNGIQLFVGQRVFYHAGSRLRSCTDFITSSVSIIWRASVSRRTRQNSTE